MSSYRSYWVKIGIIIGILFALVILRGGGCQQAPQHLPTLHR